MIFQNHWFLILIPTALILLFYAKVKSKSPSIRFSCGEFLKGFRDSFKLRLSKNIIFLRALAVVLIILAFCRPQSPLRETRVQTEGVDIVLAIDVSGSMLAEDFTIGSKRANRLAAVKNVVKDFIEARKNDRIGMIVFASRAYTVCPLTLDYGWLLKNLERVKIGMVGDGTAIGLGISCALNRLKDVKAKEKVIVLLTDGINNCGRISPLTAAEAARALKVKVYTIGAGTKGPVPFPAVGPFGNTVYRSIEIEIDEETLKKIASTTDAKYFRATDTKSLRKIYAEIDKLEKTFIEEKGYLEYKELFSIFLIPGLALLFLEIILRGTILKNIP